MAELNTLHGCQTGNYCSLINDTDYLKRRIISAWSSWCADSPTNLTTRPSISVGIVGEVGVGVGG